MSDKLIKKAIIAAAGYGTRFLPATKNIQKEMLPVINAPIIHYAVKEVIEAGVTGIVIVARQEKKQLNQYFAADPVLEHHLQVQKKMHYIQPFTDLYAKAEITVIYQDENLPYGNGTPLASAARYITPGEPFLYLFSDDLVLSEKSCCSQLVEYYQKHDCEGVLAVQSIPNELTYLYGVVKLDDTHHPPKVETIVEKPDPASAPSNLVSFGRYILPARILEYLQPDQTGKDNELWLADAIDKVAHTGNLLTCAIEGRWLTTGDPLNLLQANLEFTLAQTQYRDKVLTILKDLLERNH